MQNLAGFKWDSHRCYLSREVSRFADYRKDEPSTFSLIPEFSMYPQFMSALAERLSMRVLSDASRAATALDCELSPPMRYHLRRSHFLQTFNASPDETAYYRTLLQRECVMNSLVPQLHSS